MMKIVGFDLDDTLVAEVLFLKSGAHHIANWLNERYRIIPASRTENAMLTAIINRQNHYSALERLIYEFGLSGKIDIKEVVGEFRGHIPDPYIYHPAPSMLETLRMLKSDPEIKTMLITDGRSLTQRNKIMV